MARYFFDIDKDELTRDDDSIDIVNPEIVTGTALRMLLQIALHETVARDYRSLIVTARNAAGQPVYRAMLNIDESRIGGSGIPCQGMHWNAERRPQVSGASQRRDEPQQGLK